MDTAILHFANGMFVWFGSVILAALILVATAARVREFNPAKRDRNAAALWTLKRMALAWLLFAAVWFGAGYPLGIRF